MPALTPLFAFYRLLVLLIRFLPSGIALATDPTAPVIGTSVTVTPEIITAQLKEVEASTELDDAIKGTLTELYLRALSNLEKERASTQAAKSFSKALETTPSELKVAKKELEKLKQDAQPVTLKVSEKTPLAEVEQALLNEKANQAAVEAKLDEFEKQLAVEAERPAAIRKQITEERSRQEIIGKI